MSEGTAESGEWFGHPKGLYVLFFVEMWERFSYYGMRALLVFYMTKHLLFSQGQASEIYGLYTGLAYFTPFFGGILADRFWGQRKAVMIGGVLMAAGHFAMAFESLFFPALGLLVLGNGAFKPNVSTQVGTLYPEGDPRRDSAFSIFYVGINLGAFLSPLVCGTLGEVWGWHYGFAVAGVGMMVGLGIYLWGQKYLASDRLMKRQEQQQTAEEPLTKDDKIRMMILAVVCLFNIAFWAAYEQQGNTLALWADEDTDRYLRGWEIPATWFQSVNPFCIFFLTPFVTGFWAWRNRQGQGMGAIGKMSVGCLLLGLSFLIMVPAAVLYDAHGTPVSMFWLVGSIFVMTLGELYLSPVGLSLVTKLAPPRLVSMCMGGWFFSQFIGNSLAGYIGSYWDVVAKPHFFLLLAAMATVSGLCIALYLQYLKRTEHRKHILTV
ncbi:MAG TPA: peptide MFS transporter [Patescibacteria group bacterium]|nr:peptide MFS transporter [Patescibacteria group bacterium]